MAESSGARTAPELDGGVSWLNTERPLALRDLRGKIVLLDFWTFCCINCMHIIPDLKKLEAKYPDDLVVIGVHSAKFQNERDTINIKQAIMRYGISHPVVNDAQFRIWEAYNVNAWPTLVLIDPEGKIQGVFSGEGNYDAVDASVRKLIDSYSKQGSLNKQPLALTFERGKVADQFLKFPGKIAADPKSRRLFISDSGHNRVVVASDKGQLLAIVGSGKEGRQDGDFEHASFNHPQGLALRNNDLFVADTENHLIRRIDLKSKLVATVAGTGRQSAFGGGGGDALKTPLSSPWDLALVADKLYIAMAGSHQLWELDLKGNQVGPFAGGGRENIVDGTLRAASLAQPSGITTDGVKLYFADSEVSAVRSAGLTIAGRVHTLVGHGLFDFGDKDGPGKDARLQHPLGILWLAGKLYVADSYNHKIKVVDPLSEVVDTAFGIGKAGLADGNKAQFSEPDGLAAIGRNLYIADTNNHLVRVANLDTKEVSTLKLDSTKPAK
jgi:thiol-disulfide isomerase/thioredoxin